MFLLAYAGETQFLYASAAPAGTDRFTLVIDAGHGGKDPGAIGRFSREKNINLSVAKAFGKLVEENCPDVKVIYTRKTDVFIPLGRRAEIANRANADLFVSIHTNSLPGKAIGRGAETYTLGMARADENLEVAKRENAVILVEDNYKERYQGFDPKSSESYIIFELMQDKYMAQSVDFAKQIQKEFRTTGGRPDKGVHQAGFLVLRETSMPSVLIELGYISTHDEEAFLNSQNGIRKMSQSIYNAFLSYKRQHTKGKTTGAEKDVLQIPAGSSRFKNLSPIDFYKEGAYYKYTYGATTDYQEAIKIRNKIKEDFEGAFIVAFKNGQKMELSEAISEYKKNK